MGLSTRRSHVAMLNATEGLGTVGPKQSLVTGCERYRKIETYILSNKLYNVANIYAKSL